jgi:hypothetical protein
VANEDRHRMAMQRSVLLDQLTILMMRFDNETNNTTNVNVSPQVHLDTASTTTKMKARLSSDRLKWLKEQLTSVSNDLSRIFVGGLGSSLQHGVKGHFIRPASATKISIDDPNGNHSNGFFEFIKCLSC